MATFQLCTHAALHEISCVLVFKNMRLRAKINFQILNLNQSFLGLSKDLKIKKF